MNCFFTSSVLTDLPNDPVRIEAKNLLWDFKEKKILQYTFFVKKGFEHEQEERFRLLKERECLQ